MCQQCPACGRARAAHGGRSSATAITSKGAARGRGPLLDLLWAQGQAFKGFWHTPSQRGLRANQLPGWAAQSWALGSRAGTISCKVMQTCCSHLLRHLCDSLPEYLMFRLFLNISQDKPSEGARIFATST